MFHLNEVATTVKKLDGQDEMHYLARVDQQSAKSRNFRIDPKIYAAEIWEKPLDIIYKNSEYNVTMKEHKKMLSDYQKEKDE